MSAVGIIQARMSSSRLPGKVLMPIKGQPMLYYVCRRSSWAKSLNQIVVATSSDKSDKPIVNFCKENAMDCYMGELEDVLARYYNVAKKNRAKIIVRITADCPLIDGFLIEKALHVFKHVKADYLSNTLERTYPRGFDFEIFTFEALSAAFFNARKAEEREHVTPYIWQNKSALFRLKNFRRKNDKSRYRITVDTLSDFLLVKLLIEKYRADLKRSNQIIRILELHPELSEINKNIKQKEI